MIERKKAEGRKRRRKKDIDLINDNDDAIAKMIADMRLAAREDRDLNIARCQCSKNFYFSAANPTDIKKSLEARKLPEWSTLQLATFQYL